MKKTNINFLIGANQLLPSANFERKILNLLSEVNSSYEPKEIYLSHVGMERTSGYSSYNYVVQISFDNETFTLRKFTHDSQAWDWYKDEDVTCEITISNWKKQTALTVIEKNLFEIERLINEEILLIEA